MLIEVKQKHIDEGAKGSCSRCPIALALLDAGHRDVWIGNITLYTSVRKETYLPPKAIQWINNFDDGLPVLPFSFEIELPTC